MDLNCLVKSRETNDVKNTKEIPRRASCWGDR